MEAEYFELAWENKWKGEYFLDIEYITLLFMQCAADSHCGGRRRRGCFSLSNFHLSIYLFIYLFIYRTLYLSSYLYIHLSYDIFI